MRLKLFLLLALVLVFASTAFAQITVTFGNVINFVGFYSSEPFPLTWSDGFLTGTVTSGYGVGVFTTVNDLGPTQLTFTGTPDFYVLDDIEYKVGTGNTLYTLTFDQTRLQNCNCSIGSFYAGLPGHPVFSDNADVLTYPNYNYVGYPYESSPDVIYEGPIETSPTPEPGTLVMLGSGILAAAGVVRRKLSL
jgi:PEP-CTERM motif